MTPERRAELRRCDDASVRTRYELDRAKHLATIKAQEARISALESLLAECGESLVNYSLRVASPKTRSLIHRIDAILPATEGDK